MVKRNQMSLPKVCTVITSTFFYKFIQYYCIYYTNFTIFNFLVEYLEALNAEGRTILTEHLDSDGNHVVILNLYCPSADLDNKERTQFKLKFYSLVQQKCKNLIADNKYDRYFVALH